MRNDDSPPTAACPDGTSVRISVIIPVYNSAAFLEETLESVTRQTLESSEYEVILVDDGSDDKATLMMLDSLAERNQFNGVPVTLRRHRRNRFVSEARNTGAAAARGRFLCCVDSDDKIAEDYLKKGCLTLSAHPGAGWVYPGVRKFGLVERVIYPPPFDALKLLKENYTVQGCIFRKKAWDQVGGQRGTNVFGNVRFYEDWDMLLRLMRSGWYGVPLSEPLYLYRQNIKSTVTRNWKYRLASEYLTKRKNLPHILGIRKAQHRYEADRQAGRVFRPLSPGPGVLLDRIVGKGLSVLLKTQVHPLDWRIFLQSLTSPDKFIETLISYRLLPSMAAQVAGFVSTPKVALPPKQLQPTNTIFFVQTNWHLGGGEVVLKNWLHAAARIDGCKIINLAQDCNRQDSDHFETEFSKISHEQYGLNRMATSPLSALEICWQLFLREKPRIVFVMSNAFFYLLAPYIKRVSPRTVIMDLLHLEDFENPGWFEIADEFKTVIDRRIVVSELWKNVLIEKYGEVPGKISVVANGVDLDRFNPSRFCANQSKKQLNIDPGKHVVGFIGRLEPQKNPLLVVELARRMINRPDYEFVIVGSGSLKGRIQSLQSEIPNLKLFAETRSPEFFLSLFDVAVFPSLWEGCPLVSLEAAAMNTPVLAPDIVGFREQIGAGGFGILYSPVDLQTDVETIAGLLDTSGPNLPQIGCRGRAFVKTTANLEAIMAEMTALLTEHLQRP